MPSKRNAMTARAASLVGCGYLYGATGWICTPRRVQQQARQYPQYAELIFKYAPRWMGKPCYDCAQLTREIAAQAGVMLPSGATSQWRTPGIWAEKDVIDSLPDEAGLFLFTMRNGRMIHTGVTIGRGESVEARGHAHGVVRRRIEETTFTHWARLHIDYDAPAEAENPLPDIELRGTLREGSFGVEVQTLQRRLNQLLYDMGESGEDGRFGGDTRRAVERFQKDYALVPDGVVGPETWAQLDDALPEEEGETAALTNLVLTGAPMLALVEVLGNAKQKRGSMVVRLAIEDGKALLEQIARQI